MFSKSDHRKKSSFFPLVLFRVFLSLVMFLILGLLVAQAFLYFSGTKMDQDPLTFIKALAKDPKGALESIDISNLGDLSNLKNISNLGNLSSSQEEEALPTPIPQPSGNPILKFALVTDSHNDNGNLEKASKEAKDLGAKFVIGLGDYTDTGTIPELQKAKEIFDNGGLPYYSTAGDHDLWDSRDKKLSASQNFTSVFGSPYQSFVDSNIRFVIVYNSDNYEGLDFLQRQWLEDILEKSKGKTTFVFLHEPLFHATSDRVMGKTQEDVAKQAKELIESFKGAGVAEVFAGDIHAYSRYESGGLKMTTVGALTTERNLQPPRFTLVEVFDSGLYNVLDLELK